jgi:Skp family chaperone for outer membrane proteins
MGAGMKRFVATLVVLAAFSLPAVAQTQQVTKIGVIDFTKVLLTAYKDTRGYRDYDQAWTDYTREVASRSKEINDLQSQKLDADKAGNKTLSMNIEKSISDKQTYLDTLKRVKGTVLQQQLAGLLTGSVLQEIYDVVRFVAENGGYALILRVDTQYRDIFLYRIPEIDITDDVVAEIMKRQGKATGGQ